MVEIRTARLRGETIVGEIRNLGRLPAWDVVVYAAIVKDEDDWETAIEVDQKLDPSMLQPGQRSRFKVVRPRSEHTGATVVTCEWRWLRGADRQPRGRKPHSSFYFRHRTKE